MTVTRLITNGNSAKFKVVTKRGEFTVAMSFTLRTRIWQIGDEAAELTVATDLAEAIVSRHDPTLPFRPVYVFGEHNSETTLAKAIVQIRKHGYGRPIE